MSADVPVVVARGLSRSYGDVVALDALDLDMFGGEVLGLVGPNGAGKTTTLGLLSGVLRPTRGTVSVLGVEAGRDPAGVRELVGCLPAADATFERLTGREVVELIGRLHGLSRADAATRADDLLSLLDLRPVDRERVTGTYSTGMRRKVLLSCALVHAPRVLLLDEPLTGLDPVTIAVVRRVLRDLAAGGRAVLVSSHALDTVERLCDRVVLLADGRRRAAGTLVELRAAADLGSDAHLEEVFVALLGGPRSGDPPGWLR